MAIVLPPPNQAVLEEKRNRWTDPWRRWFEQANALLNTPVLRSVTVATLPANATRGAMVFVTDETGGATIASFDGTNWRRAADLAVVS